MVPAQVLLGVKELGKTAMIYPVARRLAVVILVQDLSPFSDDTLDVPRIKVRPFHELRDCHGLPADGEEAKDGPLQVREATGIGVLHIAPMALIVAGQAPRQPAD